MEKNKKEQAEKLQAKLDKLLQSREKKQQAFDKTKKELNALSKNIDSVKLKIFEILQSGSDDTAFSNWAKRKINETAKTEAPTGQNHNPHQTQNANQRQ
jgi:hypothetical protein